MSDALHALAVFWWSWIAPLSLQGGLLLLLVAVIDSLLPERTWPELRASLWLLALLKLVLPPSLASPFALLGWLPERLPAAGGVALGSEAESVVRWAEAVSLVWLAGLLLLAAGGGLAYRRRQRAWRAASRAELPPWLPPVLATAGRRLGLRRLPEVRLGPAGSGPFVAGLLRPRVYLPADLEPRLAEHVALHELAHVRRRDPWLAAFAAAVCWLYFFHPLAWWARRRLAELREECCDRTVARALGGAAEGYRRTLLAFAARRLDSPVGGLGLIRRRSPLLARLRRLEHAGGERPWARRLATAAVAALMLAACLPMARDAERAAAVVAETIERPPGCLQLRYLVLQRLAAEARREAATSDPSSKER